MNAIDSIKQYKELLDEGIINQDDYDLKKMEFLAKGTDKGDSIELLRAYKEILDSGAITQEEFDRKKKSLLGNATQAPASAVAAPTYVIPQDASMQYTRATGAMPANTIPVAGAGYAGVQNEYPPNAGTAYTGKSNVKKAKSAKTIKKVLIAVIGVAAIAAIAIVAISVLGKGTFKKLPGEVQMGDSLSTVISKTEKIDAGNREKGNSMYLLDDGEIYGYHYNVMAFWINGEDQLDDIWIYFYDPKLDLTTLIEKVSKVYGNAMLTDGSYETYHWETSDMDIYARQENEYLFLAFASKIY